MIKLKSLLPEWISHGITVNRNPDSALRPIPGGMNDGSPNWDGIIEGKNWWAYIGGNDYNKKLSETTIYINEGDKPHKVWIKIKTGGLRKPNDTNKSYKERIRKHATKITKSWISAAKEKHKPELNEVGNEIPVSWKESFKNSIGSVKSFILEWGESEINPINFTYRK